MPIPVIDCTDLYHPHQDCGDNIDILTPYSLPEIDLRLVLLDATNRFRNAITVPEDPALKDYQDHSGPREPGVIPMCQLNYLYGRNVPWMWGPFTEMHCVASRRGASDVDPAGCADAPRVEETGVGHGPW